MEIREKQTGGVYIIEVEGKLDSKTSSQMEKCLVSAIDNGNKEIILDFTALDFISSAGLRVLLIGVKKLKLVNGKIVLVSVKDYIKEILEISGFHTLFQVYPNLEEALNGMGVK